MPNNTGSRVTQERALDKSNRVTGGEPQIRPKSVGDMIWDWITGVFAPTPPGTELLSEEGAAAEYGAWRVLREKAARKHLQDGDYQEYRRVRRMSYDELMDHLDAQNAE